MKVRFIVVTDEPRCRKTIFDIESGHIYTEETFNNQFYKSFRELEQSSNIFVLTPDEDVYFYKIETFG